MTGLLDPMNSSLSVINGRAEMLLMADVSEVIKPNLQQIYTAENEIRKMVQSINIHLKTARPTAG